MDLQTAERRAREAAELMEQIDAEERLLAANRFLTQREREFHRMRLLRDRQIAEFNFENIRPEYSRSMTFTARTFSKWTIPYGRTQ